jgi:glucose-6-phosphate isomerase
VTFVRVLESGGAPIEVEPGVTAGDYLHGFLVGTRAALYANDRQSMTITINEVDARTVGALIALFERAVGLYSSLIHINAYDQPGVEAGKKAAADVLSLQAKARASLTAAPQTADQIAAAIGAAHSAESVYLILEHLSSNGRARMSRGKDPAETSFARS